MSAFSELGFFRTGKYVFFTFAMILFHCLLFPPLRKLFLIFFGARVGSQSILMNVKLINLYRRGISGLRIGKRCYFGNDVKLDLADAIEIGDNVTLAENVVILTHLNVGYDDHPLKKHFPSMTKVAVIGSNTFVGAGSIILAGAEIGQGVFVAAGSVVVESVRDNNVVGGNPAKVLRDLKESAAEF